MESGIPLTIGIQNPSSTDKYWNLVPGIQNPQRGVQNPRLSWIPLGCVQTDAQLPTLLRQQCWELLGACWQWCANGCNNSHQCWDLQCNVGRIQPISLCKPCIMSVRGPNNVGRAVETDPILLRYASAITGQKKRWELLAEKFDRFQTLRNNTQQHPTTCNRVCKRTQHVTSNKVGSCWPTMLRPFARRFYTGGRSMS